MSKIWIIASREFIETVRTKAFFIGAIMMPILMVGLIFGTKSVMQWTMKQAEPQRRIIVWDETGRLAGDLEHAALEFNQRNANRPIKLEVATPEDDLAALREQVRKKELYAYAVIPPTAVDAQQSAIEWLRQRVASGESPATFENDPTVQRVFGMLGVPLNAAAVSADLTDRESAGRIQVGRLDQSLQATKEIENLLNAAISKERMRRTNPPLDPALISVLQQEVPMEDVDVATGGVTSGDQMGRAMMPFIFMFLLWMGTVGISQGLLTSVIEEKSSRVVEVLLSAVSPLQLMAGKILGMVLVGFLLLGVWGAVGYVALTSMNMGQFLSLGRLGVLWLYFLPSFLLFASLLGAIGSACNTLKDAQSLTTPVMIVNIVPMLLWMPISQAPNSILSVALSFVPPVTPYVMVLRLCADPKIPVWQIVATLVLLWITVFFAVWAAAKIFRVGVLMYGKAPTPRELVKWLRYA